MAGFYAIQRPSASVKGQPVAPLGPVPDSYSICCGRELNHRFPSPMSGNPASMDWKPAGQPSAGQPVMENFARNPTVKHKCFLWSMLDNPQEWLSARLPAGLAPARVAGAGIPGYWVGIMDDGELLDALALLVDREGQRGAARLLGVNRGTVGEWVKRDTVTPRMRDAIKRGLHEYAERLELPPELRPETEQREADGGDQVALLRGDIEELTQRVEELEQWRTSLIPAVTCPPATLSPFRRWLNVLRVPFGNNQKP